ncbi:aldo/keto reductase [Pseudoalteromonas sp. SG45-5]|uniref:aldo/keto reductase n=1 Tax=unclassified Pseudoalteromonas TaxID=194690 RepID=UPI0015F90ED2|nr:MULTISPECIES: aldo/keto reductase [unclassified Pseudoalteromonas]MBB1387004.1 aldo/keto reductase [Pseudoalteromonas sp. SG45-5]MBB1395073.1 aldo/keto reductase [Pseudoalteromonas sp. SG44-4]MBB1446119.1 aldo/keto reductase [Pseudoalteromonas sp. SG41-6]
MQYSPLGSSGVDVSRVCLGSMTWGLQNTQRDADEQIAYALSKGVNFIDTAEMYAVPPSPDTYGKTEQIIGDWFSRNQQKRSDIILATKIAGNGLSWVRGGGNITRQSVIEAVDESLKRLQTDYIDLYQLHWPNRSTPHFGRQWPGMLKFTNVNTQEHQAGMLDILEGLNDCVKAGKIKHCGLSDDTPWGISQFLNLAKEHNLPRMVSIQNEFSLAHTKDWPYLIEQCVHEDIAYLPWSPLAAGLLTGKYLNGARPEGSRWTFMQRNGIFRDTPNAEQATKQYVELAHANNITPAQLALAWCNQVDGVTSSIIGATSMAQLKEDIDAFDITLSDDVLTDIDTIFRNNPMPY